MYRYVSRANPVDPSNHQILGIQTEMPLKLASQLTLDVSNAWGILHAIIDYCRELPSGKYLIMKDPNKVSGQVGFIGAGGVYGVLYN